MKQWKKKFIEFMIKKKILKFGNFTLKCNRKSPYFFNMALFHTGKDLYTLGTFYAQALVNLNIKFDLLFGIAYKGIPIVISTVIALKKIYNINIKYSFNRKEIKKYGEKGNTVGSKLHGNIVIIDDILTAGTAIKNTLKFLLNKKKKISNILVALDRKEFGNKNSFAKNDIEKKYSCKISSIINIDDITNYLKSKKIMKEKLKILLKYREKYILNKIN
ncbi:orotate phosphoribosyltransferase [Buchnera aphidicola]|uniref:orotate phosphoribosyltransferase n=1 Tax=Buchnera aphidicola TaxID=9 RepID=UPI002543A18A|nr:orotate phosphoribosyltransferase [Buchnera aphidicola]WII23655.1 orotate phosphoribosyltransferase [Buchnera aphidicola (Sipha maydis)]